MGIVSRTLNLFAHWANLLFVKTKLLPDNPIAQFDLNPNLPTFYVARLNSRADLAALDAVCKKLGLPRPTQPQRLGNNDIDRFLGLQNPTPLFAKVAAPSNVLTKGRAIFTALHGDPQIQAQIIPVTILWGRNPGKEKAGIGTLFSHSLTPSWLRKFFVLLFSGRDNLVRFSQPIDLKQLINDKSDVDELPQKLVRVARVHFHRQKLAATGPKLPSRDKLFSSLLAAPAIKKAIADEAKSKGLSYEEARLNAQELLDEIAANYSDAMVRVGDRILTWLWTKLYNGIEVKYADRVHQLADKGHEIIYVPCHRSHMDYLLLTYVIYHQGLVPPHIAAGVNLNFFPAGGIFRRSGAFFIRRSFAGNKLYSAVFKEYLSQLFIKGYSVKFYTEGGRSRTGRLLPPKTGMLAMTLQSMLRGIDRPISIVPVYIGYEHVMEINTYLKELAGNNKKNESVFAVFKAIKNLKNYGRGYLNFGEPINVNQYLTEHQSNWRDAIHPTDVQKPQWLNTQVAELADTIMTNINSATALNAINLLATILLCNSQFALSKRKLLTQLSFYLTLQRSAKYNAQVTVPEDSAEELLSHALQLNKLDVIADELGEIIAIKEKERTLFNYYRNNILHLFAVPSVIAQLLFNRFTVNVDECKKMFATLYPLFAKEWFLTPLRDEYIEEVLVCFAQQGLIEFNGQTAQVKKDSSVVTQLEMLGKVCHLTLERYAITVSLIQNNQGITRKNLEIESDVIANRLGTLHGIKSPEFFDKKVLVAFISSLKENGFIKMSDEQCIRAEAKLEHLQHYLDELLPASISHSIQDTL
ncbi:MULTISPECIES: glycerol-3-phosphate 1-O-acyltransferase PlsB [Pseudoalteromonas]|uniref:Glycerol-3-phosphate acyltransferase n=1 Tax=Pseudoalteromonas amylolytica TaxID=1859457 RepID=A0A1S1MRN4_9GAMM|nr:MULTISPECIES: glycerol-3-phosphate 1-O-acyltransferase PlsB [Pseudoalteromonas]OHU86103.1 glycerol-3-phosphate 1-O-acyltransferase [Pseudoalteromonas sp. JW3]OHU89790.1 glycerol-3-phosphate 1-O-acyltransferase [Pseudoalteromonas amylolytica]